MVSRQETARPLLTPGEVMQLPPADELVLVSGLAPIRAKKLRYYENRNFISRVADAPALGGGEYRDKPAPRSDDWGGQVRGLHVRLAAAVDEEGGLADEEGGLQQQRHPGLPAEGVTKPAVPEHETDLGLDEDQSDAAADKRTLDRLRGLGSVGRARAMNEGTGRDDLLPSF
jgi:type IV secretion system protein VirD4